MAYDDDVDIRKAHSAMLIIKALDPTARLEFLETPETKWWVSSHIVIGSDGGFVGGFLYSHANPNQAVIGYLLALQAVKAPKYVVSTADESNWKRYYFRWNGAAFARVGVEEA